MKTAAPLPGRLCSRPADVSGHLPRPVRNYLAHTLLGVCIKPPSFLGADGGRRPKPATGPERRGRSTTPDLPHRILTHLGLPHRTLPEPLSW